MKKLLLSSLVLTCLCGVTWAQQPVADLKLDFNRLKSWDTKRYEMLVPYSVTTALGGQTNKQVNINHAGISTMATEVTGDSLILTETMERQKMKMVYHCRKDNGLALLKSDMTMGNQTAIAEFKDGKMSVTANGKVHEMPFPEDTLVEPAFLRLVTLLPREKGGRFSFKHWSEMRGGPPSDSVPMTKAPLVIVCEGEDTIKLAGKDVRGTKYNLGNRYLAWVRDDGTLLRYELPGRTILELVAN